MFISKIRSSDDDVTKMKWMVSLSDERIQNKKNQIRVLQTSYRVSILTFCKDIYGFWLKWHFVWVLKIKCLKTNSQWRPDSTMTLPLIFSLNIIQNIHDRTRMYQNRCLFVLRNPEIVFEPKCWIRMKFAKFENDVTNIYIWSHP